VATTALVSNDRHHHKPAQPKESGQARHHDRGQPFVPAPWASALPRQTMNQALARKPNRGPMLPDNGSNDSFGHIHEPIAWLHTGQWRSERLQVGWENTMTHSDRPASITVGRCKHAITMRELPPYLATVLVSACVAATSSTTAAADLPQCTNTTPTTTQCERPGNVQINTSPGVITSPYMGWPWFGGGIAIGRGISRR